MIDIENKVYNDVAKAIRDSFSNFPRLSCYGEYVETPASFPCVTLVEDDNSRVTSTDDSTQKNTMPESHTLAIFMQMMTTKINCKSYCQCSG